MLTAAAKMVYKISIHYHPQSSFHTPAVQFATSQLCHYSCLCDQALKPTTDLTNIKEALWETVSNHGITVLLRLEGTS